MKNHWDKVYSSNSIENLGWYEENPEPSLTLIKKTGINKNSKIIDIGSGASTLIDFILDDDFSEITALDISEEALKSLETRLGIKKSKLVKFLEADITDIKISDKLEKYDLWHDRTLLHFLIKKEEQEKYIATLKKVVNKNGFVIIAVFAIGGAKKCSGLDVKNYDHKMLTDLLGEDFKLEHYFYHTYLQPSGNERPFVYTLFKRVK